MLLRKIGKIVLPEVVYIVSGKGVGIMAHNRSLVLRVVGLQYIFFTHSLKDKIL